jgi:hypothetical protein
MNFNSWLLAQQERDDDVGALATFAAREGARLDKHWNVVSLWQHVAFKAERLDLLDGWERAAQEFAARHQRVPANVTL